MEVELEERKLQTDCSKAGSETGAVVRTGRTAKIAYLISSLCGHWGRRSSVFLAMGG